MHGDNEASTHPWNNFSIEIILFADNQNIGSGADQERQCVIAFQRRAKMLGSDISGLEAFVNRT